MHKRLLPLLVPALLAAAACSTSPRYLEDGADASKPPTPDCASLCGHACPGKADCTKSSFCAAAACRPEAQAILDCLAKAKDLVCFGTSGQVDAKSCAAAFQTYYRCGVIDGGMGDASGDGPACARAQYMCGSDPDCCKDLRCDQGFCCADLDVACNTAADCCDDGADCIDGTCQIP